MPALMLLLLCLGTVVVHGWELDNMCHGPFQLPETVDVSVNQVSDEVFKIKVEMISTATMLINWRYFPEGSYMTDSDSRFPGIRPSPDSDTFRASTKVSGNRYTLEVQLKPEENLTDGGSRYRYELRLQLDVDFGCNVVSLQSLSLRDLVRIVRDDLDPPVIMEMPRTRHLVDVKDVIEVKVGATVKQDGRYLGVECGSDLQRRAGRLGPPVIITTKDGYYYGVKKDTTASGLSEAVCKVDMRGDLEVAYGSLIVGVWLPGHGFTKYRFTIPYEIRRRSLLRPAIRVNSTAYNPDSKPRYTIATTNDEVHSFCVVDAYIRPSVKLMKVMKDGGYRRVAEVDVRQDDTYQSRSVMNFTVKSPAGVLEREEYDCVAMSMGSKKKERFTIIRYDKVAMSAPERITMEKGNVYNLTCEATGAPQPKIKFYWSPTNPSDHASEDTFDVSGYIESNKYHKIENSADFRIKTWEKAGKTYGQITMDDLEKIGRPGDSERSGYMYNIVCVAYNDYSLTWKALATYGRWDEFFY